MQPFRCCIKIFLANLGFYGILSSIRRPFICSFVTDQVFDELLNGDQTGHPSMFVNTTGFRYYFNYLLTEMPSELGYYSSYIQLPKVRKAIHVGSRKWNTGDEVKKLLEKFYQQLSFYKYIILQLYNTEPCFQVEKHLLDDFMQSVKPWVEELIENYK